MNFYNVNVKYTADIREEKNPVMGGKLVIQYIQIVS